MSDASRQYPWLPVLMDSFIEDIAGYIMSSECGTVFEVLWDFGRVVNCFRGLWSMLQANPPASEEPGPQKMPSPASEASRASDAPDLQKTPSTASDAPGLERTLYHSSSSSGNIVINVHQGGSLHLVHYGSQAVTGQQG